MRKVIVNIKDITNKLSSKKILSDIEFTIESRNTYAIIGKNGEGKSTLLKAITGLNSPSQFEVSGKVFFESAELSKMTESQVRNLRRQKVQYLFQDPVNSFDPLKKTGYYFNNQLFKKEQINEAFGYFRLPPADKVFQLYPYELSGGMAQRIAFILAVLKNPEFLLLDEPTSGIDQETIQLISDYLKSYISTEERIVLIVTQDLKFARDIDAKIALLADNKISEFKTFQEFISNNEDVNARLFINAYNTLYNA